MFTLKNMLQKLLTGLLFSGCRISTRGTEKFALSYAVLPHRVILWHLHSSKEKYCPAHERTEYVSEHLDSVKEMLFIRKHSQWVKYLPSDRCFTAELEKSCQQGGRWKWSRANPRREKALSGRRRRHKAVLTGASFPFVSFLPALSLLTLINSGFSWSSLQRQAWCLPSPVVLSPQSKVSQNQLIFLSKVCSSAYTSSSQNKSHSQLKQGCKGRSMNFWPAGNSDQLSSKLQLLYDNAMSGKCKRGFRLLTQTCGLSFYQLGIWGSTRAPVYRT